MFSKPIGYISSFQLFETPSSVRSNKISPTGSSFLEREKNIGNHRIHIYSVIIPKIPHLKAWKVKICLYPISLVQAGYVVSAHEEVTFLRAFGREMGRS